jgi:hypothetical protein
MNSNEQSSQPFSITRNKHRAGRSKLDLEARLHHLRLCACARTIALAHAVGEAGQASLRFLPLTKIILQPNAEF